MSPQSIAQPESAVLPATYRLEAAPDLRTLANGRILLGGAPFTIMRLSAAGAETTRAWFRGDSVSKATSHQALARRLLAAGMVSPRWEPDTSQAAMTVIIPVKDDQAGLDDTLAQLLQHANAPCGPPGTPRVVVVDDGSATPVTCAYHGVTIYRNETSTGPGQARQLGLAEIDTPVVAFVDAGVRVTAADLATIAHHFDDPMVVAAAPRIRSSPAAHLVGRYDEHRSPLDLGPMASLVGPGKQVPYVPTACLIARTAAVEAAGGFDPDLRYGEDVDLVWRLGAAGAIRYCPDVEALHPPRPTVGRMASQRASYGSAAAPLALRHGEAVAPAKLSGWSVLVTLLVLLGHPAKALVAWAWTASALRPKIEPMPDATVEAVMLTGRGHWYGGLSLLTAVSRTWMPFVAFAALILPSQRRRLTWLAVAALARRLIDGPRRPGAAVVDVALGAVDDLSYCAGVWQGAVHSRSAASLKPVMTSWPKPGPVNDATRADRK